MDCVYAITQIAGSYVLKYKNITKNKYYIKETNLHLYIWMFYLLNNHLISYQLKYIWIYILKPLNFNKINYLILWYLVEHYNTFTNLILLCFQFLKTTNNNCLAIFLHLDLKNGYVTLLYSEFTLTVSHNSLLFSEFQNKIKRPFLDKTIDAYR